MAEAQVSKIFSQEELLIKVDDLEKRLQTKDAEIQVYKMLMSQMEEEVAQAKKYKALHEKQTQDVDGLRTESEKTLTKAKSMIFEKTKIIKNQELQIEAFTQQIESLREVVRITKDLLEIRNMEVHQLETKIAAIEGKQKAERERYDLMHKKLEMMIRHNGDLKREYETQLCLFTALRERYNERELAKDVIGSLKNEKLPAINGLESLIKNDPVQQTPVEATKANTSDPNVKTAEPSPANTSDQNVNTAEPSPANSPDQNVKIIESSTASTEGTNTPAIVPNDAQVSEQKPVTNDPIQPTNVAESSTSNQVEAGKANTSEQNIVTAIPSPVATDEISNEVSDPKVNVADTTSNAEQTPVKNEPPAVLNTSTTNTTEIVPIVESPQSNPVINLATEPIVKTENPLPVAETSNSKPEDKPASIVCEQGAAILESIEAAVEKKE